MGEMLAAGEQEYTELKNLVIFNKQSAGMGTFYRSQYELIFVWKNGTAPHVNNFGLGETGRYRSNVWSYKGNSGFHRDRDADLASHPTVKPWSLVADALRDCSKRGAIVLDPFGGSGTTLIAAERTRRMARLIELDPLYCDVTIRRWEKLTGLEAVLAATGQTFADVAAERGVSAHSVDDEERDDESIENDDEDCGGGRQLSSRRPRRRGGCVMTKSRNSAAASGEVGPGRPPKHSRFKPGVSGNPKGRPPKQRDLKKLIEDELDQAVWIIEGGRRVRLTKREIVAKKLVNDAAQGEDKALATLIKLIGTTSETVSPYSALDAGQIAAFLARHLASADDGSGGDGAGSTREDEADSDTDGDDDGNPA